MNLSDDILTHPVFTQPLIAAETVRGHKKTPISVFIGGEYFAEKTSFSSKEIAQLESLMVEAYSRKFAKTCSKACEKLYAYNSSLSSDALFSSVLEGFPQLLLESTQWMPQQLRNKLFFQAIEMVHKLSATTIQFFEKVCKPNRLEIDVPTFKSLFWNEPEKVDIFMSYYLKYNTVEDLYTLIVKMPEKLRSRYENSFARVQQKKLMESVENEVNSAVPSKRKL